MTDPSPGPKRPQKVRAKPRISINKLAEYLSASARRRTSIIKEQKYPNDFQVIWYARATKAIVGFLCGKLDKDDLVTRIDRLLAKPAANPQQQIKFRNNAEAIQAFLACCDSLQRSPLLPSEGPRVAPKFSFDGVEVSVRPEVLLEGTVRNKNVAGAVKLYFSKDKPLSEESGTYVSALVHHHVEELLEKKPSKPHCLVLDVFGKKFFETPNATVDRMHNVRAACTEIRDRWANI